MKSLVNDVISFFEIDNLFMVTEEKNHIENNGCDCNFNRKIDLKCISNALQRFMTSGKKDDAFDIYFAFCEFFNIFNNSYERMDELLRIMTEFESNSGSLVFNHRDHYVHSVYVFCLGLIIYNDNPTYREVYKNFYKFENEKAAREGFLRDWGLTSLFHDIGYPLELSHDQFLSYAKQLAFTVPRQSDLGKLFYPKIGITNAEEFSAITCGEAKIRAFANSHEETNVNNVLAMEVCKKVGADYEDIKKLLADRIKAPFQKLDHGYFSAVILLKTLLKVTKDEYKFTQRDIDVVTGIFLHNSFYKYDYKTYCEKNDLAYAKLKFSQHPLAALLLLCDELQCWDRVAFGSQTKKEIAPFDIRMRVNETSVGIVYKFDEAEIKKDGAFDLKNYNEINSGAFAEKILNNIIDYREIAEFCFGTMNVKRLYYPENNLSSCKFVSLYHFAVAINSSYLTDCDKEGLDNMDKDFLDLPLEYKLSNIAQAKSYAKKLDLVRCFYSDTPLKYGKIKQFTTEQLEIISREEHIRWVQEKIAMDWKYGTDYQNRVERSQKRIHKDLLQYDDLAESDKKKDIFPMQNMIALLNQKLQGVHIYSLDNVLPKAVVGFTGHIKLANPKLIYENIKIELIKLKSQYNMILICQFAAGADLLFAQAALELDLPLKAYLAKDTEDFIAAYSKEDRELFFGLIAQVYSKTVIKDSQYEFRKSAQRMIKDSDILLAVWDRVKLPLKNEQSKLINQGGTCYNVTEAEKLRKEIIIIDVE